MAKKSKRTIIQLECSKCRRRNYTTSKNPQNQPKKMKLLKYCSGCRKRTEHKEVRISKAKKK